MWIRHRASALTGRVLGLRWLRVLDSGMAMERRRLRAGRRLNNKPGRVELGRRSWSQVSATSARRPQHYTLLTLCRAPQPRPVLAYCCHVCPFPTTGAQLLPPCTRSCRATSSGPGASQRAWLLSVEPVRCRSVVVSLDVCQYFIAELGKSFEVARRRTELRETGYWSRERAAAAECAVNVSMICAWL